MSTIDSGQQAEALAVQYLKKQRCKILGQNYRCRFGEIDIIALDNSDNPNNTNKNIVIFVEVRYRQQHQDATNSIDFFKQQKISLTAQHYIAHHAIDNICRFDAILINKNKQLRWIKNAFEAPL